MNLTSLIYNAMKGKFQTIDPNDSNRSHLSEIVKVNVERDRLPDGQHDRAARVFLLSDAIASGMDRDLAFVKSLPNYIKRIMDEKSWECLYVAKGVMIPYYCRYNKGTDSENFCAFITAKRPNGLGTTVEEVDALLALDPEIRSQFRNLVYGDRQLTND